MTRLYRRVLLAIALWLDRADAPCTYHCDWPTAWRVSGSIWSDE